MKKKEKNTKGITLIALVITIIVLLILAGVSIAMLTGQNGILTQANSSTLKTEQGTLLEELRLQSFEKSLDENFSTLDMESYLKQKGILKGENNEIDLSKLSSEYSTGKGSFEEGDIYYEIEGNLYYKNSDGEETNVGKIFAVETALTEDIYEYGDSEKTFLTGILDEYKRYITTNTIASLLNDNEFPILFSRKVASLNTQNIKLASSFGKDEPEYDIVYNEKIVTSLIIPDHVITIYTNAFANAVSIEKVKIQQGCTSIQAYAFYNCKNLTSIEIPASLTNIANNVFIGCNENLKVLIHNTEENLPFNSNWGISKDQVEYLGT